jgi:hypothetical protein
MKNRMGTLIGMTGSLASSMLMLFTPVPIRRRVIEFPPGSTIDIPSSLVIHSNTTIEKNESRVSFTQYTTGALFPWVDQGCRTEARCKADAPKMFSKLREGDAGQFEDSCGLYSTVPEFSSQT